MKKFLLPALLSVGFAASAFGGFAKSVTFTTSGYHGSGTLANFPVLVKLSSSIGGFDYADFGTTTNMLFRDASGNVIPHDIDTWDTNGTSLVWVSVPSVTTATTFTMYYCGSADSANNSSATWTGASYIGVWHMDEASGPVADATGHGLTATPAGDASVSVRYARTADVPVGHARETGVSGTKAYLSIPSYDSFNVGATFTMSGWVRLHTRTGSPRLFSRKDAYNSNNGWEFQMNSSDQNFQARGASYDKNLYSGSFASSLHRNWTHVALVYDGSTLTVYGNGEMVKSDSTITPATDNSLPMSFGCDSDGSESAWVEGAFDECRLLDAVASADWIAAEYATVMSNDFVTAGSVTEVAPTLGAVAVMPESKKSTLSGAILSPGAGATSCDIYLSLGTSAGALGAVGKIASGAMGSFEYVIRDLSPNTTYYYELSATNNASSPACVATTGSFTTTPVFDYRRKVTFTVNYTNANDFTDIPVLVKLSTDSPVGFRYSDCAADGSDIRFLDEGGNAIPHEIDTWDPNGESLIWVRAPAVTEGTSFSMFYNGTSGAANDPQAVWTEYTGVWHLNGCGEDATPYSQGLYPNSTAEIGIDGHVSTMSVTNETGRFGKSFRTNDSTGQSAANYKEGGVWVNDSGTDSPLDAGGVFTISGWFKHADWNYNYDKIFFKRPNENSSPNVEGSFASLISSNARDTKMAVRGASSTRLRLGDGSPVEIKASMIDNWVYLTLVFNGTNCRIYENGELCKSGTIAAATDNDHPLVFGNNTNVAGGETGDQAWNGWIDEVRYLKAAKSAEWIAVEYAAMADDGFLVAGAVEKIGSQRTIFLVQ